MYDQNLGLNMVYHFFNGCSPPPLHFLVFFVKKSLKGQLDLNNFRILQPFAVAALVINETQLEFRCLKGVFFLSTISACFS